MDSKLILPQPVSERSPKQKRQPRWAPAALLFSAVALFILSACTNEDGVASATIRKLPGGLQRWGPWKTSAVLLPPADIDLATNEHWATNFDLEVLQLAQRPDPQPQVSTESTVAAIRRLAETLPREWPRTYIYEVNAQRVTVDTLNELADCMESGTCKPGQTQVIIAGDLHFGNQLSGGVSGEDIWARSSIDAFRELGHTVLFAYDVLEVLAIYQAMPHMVSNVLLDISQIKQCSQLGVPRPLKTDDMKRGATVLPRSKAMAIMRELEMLDGEDDDDYFDEDFGASRDRTVWGWPQVRGEEHQNSPGCVRRKGFEDGIPIQKMFTFHFWNGPEHPLGEAWTLSPEPFSTHPSNRDKQRHNFYLGYSVEKWCKAHKLPEGEKRQDRAFVFAKDKKFFDQDTFVFWNQNRTFENLHAKTGLQFVAAAGDKASALPEQSLNNLGKMPVERFYKELAQSKALIGVGRPPLSPTPYDALCLGVPFINPILRWDEQDPDNREEWRMQQDGLLRTERPYVYHVFAGDHEGLEKALKDAAANPFESYILPAMTTEANRIRHQAFVNLNWRVLAADRLERMGSGFRVPYLL